MSDKQQSRDDLHNERDRLLHEVRALRQRIAHFNLLDELTGLYSIGYFSERLRDEVVSCTRYRQEFSLIMCDVDNFEGYCERVNTAAGDEILKIIATCIKECTRDADKLFRFDKSKFAVLLPHTGLSGSLVVAENMRQKIEGVLRLESSNRHINLTLSLGAACFPEDGLSADELVRMAEAARIAARNQGRNRICTVSDVAKQERRGKGDIKSALNRTKGSPLPVIYAMASAVDPRQPFTPFHSQNVAQYAVLIGNTLGLPIRKRRHLRSAALLHDIGKIEIPEEILRTPKPLTDEEIRLLRKHPEIGAGIVNQVPELADYVLAIRHHHEHYDGSGYPDGLKGDAIPVEARIIAVADVYDNLIHPRLYRNQVMSPQEALQEIRKQSSSKYDPAAVMALVKVITQPHS